MMSYQRDIFVQGSDDQNCVLESSGGRTRLGGDRDLTYGSKLGGQCNAK